MSQPTREQWRKLYQQIAPSLRLFGRLRVRLQRVGISSATGYGRAVENAYDAIHTVSVQTHYASCDGGVGGADRVMNECADQGMWAGDGI